MKIKATRRKIQIIQNLWTGTNPTSSQQKVVLGEMMQILRT